MDLIFIKSYQNQLNIQSLSEECAEIVEQSTEDIVIKLINHCQLFVLLEHHYLYQFS